MCPLPPLLSQVCPDAVMQGNAPAINSANGQLSDVRSSGECHIPQTPYVYTPPKFVAAGSGGQNQDPSFSDPSCHTAQ